MDFFSNFDDDFGGFPFSGFGGMSPLFSRNFQPQQRRRNYGMMHPRDSEYPQQQQYQRPARSPQQRHQQQPVRRAEQQQQGPVRRPEQQQQQVPVRRPEQQPEPKATRTRVIPVDDGTKKVWKAPPKDLTQDEAAKRIQSAARGFAVRRAKVLRNLRQIAEARRELEGFRAQVEDAKHMDLVRDNFKERVKLTEGVMRLLLQLDSIQGAPFVREARKATVRQIVQLQERIDALLQQKVETGESNEAVVQENEMDEDQVTETAGRQEQTESDMSPTESEADHEKMDAAQMDRERVVKPEKQDEAQESITAQESEQKLEIERQPEAVVDKSEPEKQSEVQATVLERDSEQPEKQSEVQATILEQDNEQPEKQSDAQEMSAATQMDVDKVANDDQQEANQDVNDDDEVRSEVDADEDNDEVQDMQAQTLELVEQMERALGRSEQQQQQDMDQQEEHKSEEDVIVNKEVVCSSRKREREEEPVKETKQMMAQLASDNQELKLLVAECLRQLNRQSALMSQLNDRVQRLEKKCRKVKQRKAV